ncbi:MAG: N-acetyltransferase family protein [Haloarculaceae archaeon]
MDVTETLAFDHRDRKDIYEHVERFGSVAPEAVREALEMEPRAFGHHVAILKRDGVLEAVDGDLRVAYDQGAEEEFHEDDVDFVIRQARQEDLTGLVGAIRDVVEAKTYVQAETVADVVDNEGVLLRHNELESRIFFVATVGDEVVGWVHLNAPETEKLSHTAELTLGVLAAYRGHGIGSHLLERGLEWAGSHGYEKIYQSIPSTNEEAIAFLKANDWRVEAVREGHYKLAGEYIDEVMMAKDL